MPFLYSFSASIVKVPGQVTRTKKEAYFRSWFDPFSRKQKPVFFKEEIVQSIFQLDVIKLIQQIKSCCYDMFQAIRALAVQKFLKQEL